MDEHTIRQFVRPVDRRNCMTVNFSESVFVGENAGLPNVIQAIKGVDEADFDGETLHITVVRMANQLYPVARRIAQRVADATGRRVELVTEGSFPGKKAPGYTQIFTSNRPTAVTS